MEPQTLICTADGNGHALPHRVEELLEILDHARRYGETPGLELAHGGGVVWINPNQVTTIRALHSLQCSCCGEAMQAAVIDNEDQCHEHGAGPADGFNLPRKRRL